MQGHLRCEYLSRKVPCPMLTSTKGRDDDEGAELINLDDRIEIKVHASLKG